MDYASPSICLALLLAVTQGLRFVEPPQDIETWVGESILLRCVSDTRVEKCQWTWRPLQQPDAKETVVKEFSAFGNESQDCSVRFRRVLAEQQGLWTCGVRGPQEVGFLAAPAARLTLLPPGVKFLEPPTDMNATVGDSVLLRCLTDAKVEQCKWMWRPLQQPNATELVVKQFPAFGNQSQDCSVQFASISAEQAGLWSCGVLVSKHTEFQTTKPARLILRPSGLTFVQLSQDLQVALGEPVYLRCVLSGEVDQCKWTWRPLNDPNATDLVVKEFPAFGDGRRDCSVRFRSVLSEQEGFWTCAARGQKQADFQLAPPATLNLLPPVRARFLEEPQSVEVRLGDPVVFRCVATTEIEECQWTWRPLGEPEVTPTVVSQFPGAGNKSQDCSVHFGSTRKEQQGLWECAIRIPQEDSYRIAAPANLTILPTEEVTFVELSQDLRVAIGQPVLLRCVAASKVKQCKWTWRPLQQLNATETVVKEFPPFGNQSRDCSVKFRSMMSDQEGVWTCSVRGSGHRDFQTAPPAKLSLLSTGHKRTISALQDTTDRKYGKTLPVLICSLESMSSFSFCLYFKLWKQYV